MAHITNYEHFARRCRSRGPPARRKRKPRARARHAARREGAWPADASAYELLEDCGRGVSATVRAHGTCAPSTRAWGCCMPPSGRGGAGAARATGRPSGARGRATAAAAIKPARAAAHGARAGAQGDMQEEQRSGRGQEAQLGELCMQPGGFAGCSCSGRGGDGTSAIVTSAQEQAVAG